MTKAQAKERDDALARLREWLKPGDTVYTVMRHRSESGMMRAISALGIEGSKIADYTGNVAHALDWRYHRDHGGVVVNGCGMDMGFHLVYALSATMFPEGFGCIGDGAPRCPGNDHSNGDRDYTLHGSPPIKCPSGARCYCHGEPALEGQLCSACGCAPVPHWHRAGGYALRQRWL